MTLTSLLHTFNEEKVVEKVGDKYVEKDLDGISLKGVLQRGRLQLIRERSQNRQGVTFRPATITFSYCRRIKIAQLAGLVDLYDNKAAPRQQLVFDMGNAVHDIVQGYFWEMGILRGSFKCIKCDKIYHDLTAPTHCPSGIKSHTKKCLKYKEIAVEAPEYLIRGRIDGELDIEGDYHLVDIKSIKNKSPNGSHMEFTFEDLENGPKEEHVIQLTLYMWMRKVYKGHLLYVAKNTPQIKTFAIPYDYSIIEPYLNEIKYLINTAENLRKGHSVVLPAPCGNDKCDCHNILSQGIVQDTEVISHGNQRSNKPVPSTAGSSTTS